MRRVHRVELPARVQAYLDRKAQAIGAQDIDRAWRAARQTQALAAVVRALQSMMGSRQRCMYCVDSHGGDIEHFWPKARYPTKAFLWPNLLLCCAECGRFKGDRFPLTPAGEPLLVDPSAENPWDYLDFDPDTGNLVARYDVASGATLPKGEHTVQMLHLDRREAVAEGYLRTYRRLVNCVKEALAQADIHGDALVEELCQLDDHGLMGWCFGPIGKRMPPFDELHRRAPDAWNACVAAA